MKKSKNYFDGHHWEGCFAVTCGKKCPYTGLCLGAQAQDERAVKKFIDDINERPNSDLVKKVVHYFKAPKEEDIISKLTYLENIELKHAKSKHGVRFDEKKGMYYFDKNAQRNYTDTGVGSFIYR